MTQEYKGHDGKIIVDADSLTLKFSKFWSQKKTKTIALRSLSSIILNKPTINDRLSYIEFITHGGEGSKDMKSLKGRMANEFAVLFVGKRGYETMSLAKQYIEFMIANPQREPDSSPTASDPTHENRAEDDTVRSLPQTVECAGCGAPGILRQGETASCEYCGGSLA